MDWIKKTKRSLAAIVICSILMPQTLMTGYYDDDYDDDGGRRAGTVLGTAGTGALIGGLAGGGRGAAIGAGVGLGAGLLATSGSSRRSKNRKRNERRKRQQMAYDRGMADATNGRSYRNRYHSESEQDAYDHGWEDGMQNSGRGRGYPGVRGGMQKRNPNAPRPQYRGYDAPER